MRNKGIFLIISGPSGSGKDSILRKLLLTDKNYFLSISDTTRDVRFGEKPGFHYRFITKDEFSENILTGKMLEWAEYGDEYYGTEKGPVLKKLEEGKDVFLEIEVKGALKVMDLLPEVITIFIMPPSFEELRKRLIERGTETEEDIAKRLDLAKIEIGLAKKYDYIVFNNDIDIAVKEINCIIYSEKLRYNKMKIEIEEVLKNV